MQGGKPQNSTTQSLAISSPQVVPAPQQPESPESIPAQEESSLLNGSMQSLLS